MRGVFFFALILVLFWIGCGNNSQETRNNNVKGDSTALEAALVVSRQTDTVHLNEIFSAHISLTNPPEGYTCDIYKSEDVSDTMNIHYKSLAKKSVEATYTVVATKLGQHEYGIFALTKKCNAYDSIIDHQTYEFRGKYWVIP